MTLTSIQRSILECAANPANQYVIIACDHVPTMNATADLERKSLLRLRAADRKQASYYITPKGREALK